LQNVDFKTFINGASNDLKMAINDVISVISIIHEDVDKLKIKISKPDKVTAQALLEYLSWEDCNAKSTMETLFNKELEQYMRWLDDYCNEFACTREQILNEIINGEV